MRKILISMILSISLASCVSVQQYTTTNIIDYSEFAKQGIFVSESNSVSFDYQPLGSVVSITQGGSTLFYSQRIDANEAFKEIASKVKSVGGNGLINFKFNVMTTKSSSLMTVSGMAIRINNPSIELKELPVIERPNIKDKPKTDMYVDGIHCFIYKRFQSGVAVMTDDTLTIEQAKFVYEEFALKNMECQFFLPKTKAPYMGITNNGYIVDYKTNEFIPLE